MIGRSDNEWLIESKISLSFEDVEGSGHTYYRILIEYQKSIIDYSTVWFQWKLEWSKANIFLEDIKQN